MKRLLDRMNPFLRGMLAIAVIAVIVIVLQLNSTLIALYILLSLALLLAMTFFVYLVWREHRHAISMWPLRARLAFYGGALLIVADLVVRWLYGAGGLEALAFVIVIVLCGFAMFRVWRDQHRYS